MTSKSSNPFPPELRTSSFVPRWNIVWTIRPDNVAGHSFYVAVYTRMIARLINWNGPIADLLTYALLDDIDETITGDITGPVKGQIIDPARADDFVTQQMEHKMPMLLDMMIEIEDSPGFEAIKHIIKAADRLDALLFLMVDRRLGNRNLENRIKDATIKLEAAWRDLPAPFSELNRLWQTVVIPAIEAHNREGGDGVW